MSPPAAAMPCADAAAKPPAARETASLLIRVARAVRVPSLALLHWAALAGPVLLPASLMRSGTFQQWQRSEQVCFTVAFSAAHLLCYWLANLYYTLVAKVPGLQKHQIEHPARKRGNPPELIRAAIVDALGSTLAVGPLLTWFAFPVFKRFGMDVFGPLPSVQRIIRDVLLSALFTDTTFYWTHRLLHHRSLYARIHKQHHEFKGTVGLASEYDHPVEDAANTLTTVGGPMLLGSHAAVTIAFVMLRLHQTVDSHSGYALPWPLSAWAMWPCSTATRRHDYHHTDNVGNYGDWLPFWDWLCGTDVHWKRAEARKAAGKLPPSLRSSD